MLKFYEDDTETEKWENDESWDEFPEDCYRIVNSPGRICDCEDAPCCGCDQ